MDGSCSNRRSNAPCRHKPAGAKAELQRAAETAQIHRAHLDRAADEARHWAALSNELELMGGRVRLCLLCLVSLLPGCMGRGSDPARLPPPNVSADLLAPCAGYTGAVPTTEGQLSNALIA